jgi:hypothetical protein
MAISLRWIARQRMVWTREYPVEENPMFAERSDKQCMDNHDIGLSPIPANRRSIL